MSIKTDAAYARQQLAGITLSDRNPCRTYDRVRRALDALERIEANAPDDGDQNETDHHWLRGEMCRLHKKLQAQPNKIGFNPRNVGSILNAYREGDVSFTDACKLLTVTTLDA